MHLATILSMMGSAIGIGPALGYIGPGATAGAIAAVLGVLGSIVLAIFSLLWYPFKRLLRGWRSRASMKEDQALVDDE